MAAKRIPNDGGYLVVKNDLFSTKRFNEENVIQLIKHKDGMFGRPLSQIFGFFEATYYLMIDAKERTFELHLLSDKPFSFSEIRVLKQRLNIGFGCAFKHFSIYQEPDSDQNADKWMSLRSDTDDVPNINRAYNKHKGTYTKTIFPYDKKTGINRKIGKIYEFDSTHFGEDYDWEKLRAENKKAEKLTKKDIANNIINYIKITAKIKSLGRYELVDISKDKVTNTIKINILSDDRRIKEVMENKEINKKVCDGLGISRLIIDEEDLSGEDGIGAITHN